MANNTQTISIHEVIKTLDYIAPQHWQESYDNAGLIIGNAHETCTGVLVCLDSTEEVIDEAIHLGCNLVVAHHPIIFSGLKKINSHHYVEKTIIKAIKHDIAIFAIHTNLDNAYWNGVNGRIARQIGISNFTILQEKIPIEPMDRKIGAGIIGELQHPMTPTDFMNHIKSAMDIPFLKHTKIIHDTIFKVAVCGGSGSFLIKKAILAGADAYITSDIKYHEFFEANDEILILDIGHYESEKYTIDLLYTILQKKFSTFAVHFTKHITNPVYYL